MSEGHGDEPTAPGSWRPTSDRQALMKRAHLLARTRAFFERRGVLEVETPILSAAGVTDPQIESLMTRVLGMPGRFFLSTSPEFPMKRLLAAGSGDIYQLCKVFRDGERGRWHNPEFTLLEWYRLGFDDAALMTEVEALLGELLAPERRLERAERPSYAEAMRRHAGVDPHAASDKPWSPVLRLRLPRVAGVAGAAQAGFSAGGRTLRAVSRRRRARQRLS